MPTFCWTTDVKEAAREQLALRELICLQARSPCFTRGLAIGTAYDESSRCCLAVGIPFDQHGTCKEPLDVRVREISFPYLPGLLAFRVGPAVCALLDDVADEVDLLLFDAQGIAHPRGIGLASHIGVLYDKSSIGITRNPLFGRFVPPVPGRFNYTNILHPERNTTIGYALSLEVDCEPVYVSPGHRISLPETLEMVCKIAGRGCFPKPLRRAHAAANAAARTLWRKRDTQNRLEEPR